MLELLIIGFGVEPFEFIDSFGILVEHFPFIEVHVRAVLLEYHGEFASVPAPKQLLIHPLHILRTTRLFRNGHFHVEHKSLLKVSHCNPTHQVVVHLLCLT